MRSVYFLAGVLIAIPQLAFADNINLRCDEQNHTEHFNVSVNGRTVSFNGTTSPDIELVSMEGAEFSFSRNISGAQVKAIYSISKDLSYQIQMYVNGAAAGKPQLGSCVRQ